MKSKKRGGRGDEQFARLTESLMQHPALATISHLAFRVLVILTIGARPPSWLDRKDVGRNGTQALTLKHARVYGIKSNDLLTKAIAELIDRRLIVQTRAGMRLKNRFALYAVAWLPITHRDGQPLNQHEPAPMGHDAFVPIETKKRRFKRKESLEMPSGGRIQKGPVLGNETIEMPSDSRIQPDPVAGFTEGICSPVAGFTEQICHPVAGHTLRLLGTHLPTAAQPSADQTDQTARPYSEHGKTRVAGREIYAGESISDALAKLSEGQLAKKHPGAVAFLSAHPKATLRKLTSEFPDLSIGEARALRSASKKTNGALH